MCRAVYSRCVSTTSPLLSNPPPRSPINNGASYTLVVAGTTKLQRSSSGMELGYACAVYIHRRNSYGEYLKDWVGAVEGAYINKQMGARLLLGPVSMTTPLVGLFGKEPHVGR